MREMPPRVGEDHVKDEQRSGAGDDRDGPPSIPAPLGPRDARQAGQGAAQADPRDNHVVAAAVQLLSRLRANEAEAQYSEIPLGVGNIPE